MVATSFLCSTCNVEFKTDHDRREHFRSQWHVSNVKRRMDSLSPVSLEEYERQITSSRAADLDEDTLRRPITENKQTVQREQPPHDKDESEDDEDTILPCPEECLFCAVTSNTIDQNIAHMKTTHGFEIPSIETLQTDLETFISYLGVVIMRYCSCLYCGHTRHSAEAIRAHMLSKGHCMLDLSAESEFLEFWEDGDSSLQNDGDGVVKSTMLSETEMRLPSGAIASNRHSRQQMRNPKGEASSSDLALVSKEQSETTGADEESSAKAPQSQALSERDQMGVVGLSDQQRRSLMAVEKKIQARELRQRGARMWALEKEANRQKTFKVSSRPIPPWYSGRING